MVIALMYGDATLVLPARHTSSVERHSISSVSLGEGPFSLYAVKGVAATSVKRGTGRDG